MTEPITIAEVSARPSSNIPALLRLAFRPFFLLGSLFSIFSLLLWAAAITGALELSVYGGPLWWHSHEMLFGFVSAIVVGFLLTAVQNWTGQQGVRSTFLACLVLLWLAGRVVFFLPAFLPFGLLALIDIAFLPLAALTLAWPVVRVKQWRNIIFVPLLLAMTLANMAMHCSVHTQDALLQFQAGNAMVLLVTLLMSIMAGRVLPMFTANGTKTPRVEAIGWLEKAALITMLLAVAAVLGAANVAPGVVAWCCFAAAASHAVRAARWRIWVTLRTPLVWSLHLSYWCIPLGLLLWGLSIVTPAVTHSQAVHTLTVGAMGMMILAMISRVSLGHTGRPITVGKGMALAYIALFSAFVVRVFGLYWIDNYAGIIVSAVVLWVLAYGSFVVLYLPILSRPRLDGGPG